MALYIRGCFLTISVTLGRYMIWPLAMQTCSTLRARLLIVFGGCASVWKGEDGLVNIVLRVCVMLSSCLWTESEDAFTALVVVLTGSTTAGGP